MVCLHAIEGYNGNYFKQLWKTLVEFGVHKLSGQNLASELS